MKIIIVIAGLILLAGSSIIYCAGFNNTDLFSKYKCRIEQNEVNGRLIFSAIFKNCSAKPVIVFYKFVTKKSGISGTSSNSQSGTEQIKGYSEILLSKVSLNFNRSDKYKTYIKIFKENVIISSDSLIINYSRQHGKN